MYSPRTNARITQDGGMVKLPKNGVMMQDKEVDNAWQVVFRKCFFVGTHAQCACGSDRGPGRGTAFFANWAMSPLLPSSQRV